MRVVCAALIALVTWGSQAFAQDRLRVVATTADLKSLVEAVGGGAVEVESLAAPEQDPHVLEIKPGQIARLKTAALVVKIGLDHEPWLARLPLAGVKVLDVSKSVQLLQTETPRLRTERTAHVHAAGNTHYWLDPRNARPMTAAILDALAALRPGEKAAFDASRAAFLSRLDARIATWESELSALRGTRVVVMHDSWAYFAQWLGLVVVAAAEPNPGIPPSPAELALLFQRMREAAVPVLLAEPHSDPGLVRQIADKGGARPVVLLPSAFDYIGLFDENVKRLRAAAR